MTATPLTPTQAKEKPEPFRSFTVRVPQTLYIKLADLAKAEGIPLNKKCNSLFQLGLGEQVRVDEVLMRLIRKGTAE